MSDDLETRPVRTCPVCGDPLLNPLLAWQHSVIVGQRAFVLVTCYRDECMAGARLAGELAARSAEAQQRMLAPAPPRYRTSEPRGMVRR